MLSKNLKIGQLVEASCGRDEGRKFFIIDLIEPDYCLICDGKNRKLQSPKKKKLKHLNISNYADDDVRRLLCKNELTDSFLRSRLNELMNA